MIESELQREAKIVVALFDEFPGDAFPEEMAVQFVRALARGEIPRVRFWIEDARIDAAALAGPSLSSKGAA